MNSNRFCFHPLLHSPALPFPMRGNALWYHLLCNAVHESYVEEVRESQRKLHSWKWPQLPSFDFDKELSKLLPSSRWLSRIVARFFAEQEIRARILLSEAMFREAAKRNANLHLNVFLLYAGLVKGETIFESSVPYWNAMAEFEMMQMVAEDGEEAADALAYAVFSAAEKGKLEVSADPAVA